MVILIMKLIFRVGLTNRQVSNLHKAFHKTFLSKIIEASGFHGRIFGPLLKAGLRLMKYVFHPLAKSVLIPLGLTASAASPADGRFIKKLWVQGW